jgi:hypothetical protein
VAPVARRPDVAALPLDDDVVLYAQGDESAFVLNQTASRIWSLCDGTRTAETIAGEIAADYGVAYDQALSDVRDFVVRLRRAGLLA